MSTLVDRNVAYGIASYIYKDGDRFTASADVIGEPRYQCGTTYHDTLEQAEARCEEYVKQLLPDSLRLCREDIERRVAFAAQIEARIKELS